MEAGEDANGSTVPVGEKIDIGKEVSAVKKGGCCSN